MTRLLEPPFLEPSPRGDGPAARGPIPGPDRVNREGSRLQPRGFVLDSQRGQHQPETAGWPQTAGPIAEAQEQYSAFAADTALAQRLLAGGPPLNFLDAASAVSSTTRGRGVQFSANSTGAHISEHPSSPAPPAFSLPPSIFNRPGFTPPMHAGSAGLGASAYSPSHTPTKAAGAAATAAAAAAGTVQRPGRLAVAHTFREGAPTRTQSHHYVMLEDGAQVAGVDLELTLQHSQRIDKVSAAELLPLVPSVQPYIHGMRVRESRITGFRGTCDVRKGAFFVPSELTDSAATGGREVVSGVLGRAPPGSPPVVVQLYVLFPSLMKPPRWLRKEFALQKKAAVLVDWGLSRRTSFFLHLMRRLQLARSQHLTVWVRRRRLMPGESFWLGGAEGTAELTDASYVVAFKFFERRDGPQPRTVPSAGSADGVPMPSGSPFASTLARAAAAAALGSLALRSPGAAAAAGVPSPTGAGPGPGPVGAGPSVWGNESLLLQGGGSFGPGNYGGSGLNALASSVVGGISLKGYSRVEALALMQEVMRAQTSDLKEPPKCDTWQSIMDAAIQARDSPALRLLLDSRYVDHLLKRQEVVDKIEVVATSNNDPLLMLLLYEHTAVEMDLRVLAFLVHAWGNQPLGRGVGGAQAGRRGARRGTLEAEAEAEAEADLPEGVEPGMNIAARVEEFLVKYVVHRRNPLSSTAAILKAIQDEMDLHDENRRVMRLARSRFHSLHLALLRRLNRYAEVKSVRLVERILQPVDVPNTVNEVSPLQVAFDDGDLKFMTEVLIEVYTKVQWVGTEMLALTSHEDPRSMGATNPLLAYAVLRTLGFAGKGTLDPLVMLAARLWHLYAFTSTAFFDSPRGRWVMHAMFELMFLGLYQWQVAAPPVTPEYSLALHLVFLSFILGNLTDMLQFVHYRYGSLQRIRRYLSDPWNGLSLAVNSALLLLTLLKVLQDVNVDGLPPHQTSDAIHMCMAVLAVFVWVRAMGMAVPLYPSLGPLLNTVARMMEDLVAFLFPMIIILTGFTTMLFAVYQDQKIQELSTFGSTMLYLFGSMLGGFDFTIFDGLSDVLFYYGVTAQVVFLVASAILLLNLLVAIITNRYQPEEVEAETQFKKAQIVNFYQTQVTHHLVCSPFCLVQAGLHILGMPRGSRDKISGSARRPTKLGLLPLDGVVLPDDSSGRPTGLGELPYLVFLLCVYPVMIIICVVLFVLYTPFGIWQFASRQTNRFAKRYGRRRGGGKRGGSKRGSGSSWASGQAGGGEGDGGGGVKSRWNGGKGKRGGDTSGAESGPDPPARGTLERAPELSRKALSGAHLEAASMDHRQFMKFKKALQANSKKMNDVSAVKTAGFALGTLVFAVLGTLYYTVLMVLVLTFWSGLYQLIAKVLYSLYNILLRPVRDWARQRRRARSGRVAPEPHPAPPSEPSSSSPPSHPGSRPGSAEPGRPSPNGLAPLTVPPASTEFPSPTRAGPSRIAASAVPPVAHSPSGGTPQRTSNPDRPSNRTRSPARTLEANGTAGGFGGLIRAVTGRHDPAQGASQQGGVRQAAGAAPSALNTMVGGLAGMLGGGGGAGREGDEAAQRRHKAKLHWQRAFQKVVAQKNERYLPLRDVLKAVAASKFKPHMASWSLSVDPRATAQDIVEAQLQDLEDDDNEWDDDELNGDDDTLETAILDKTEALTEMVQAGQRMQAEALDALVHQVAMLTHQLAEMQAASAGGGGGAGGPPSPAHSARGAVALGGVESSAPSHAHLAPPSHGPVHAAPAAHGELASRLPSIAGASPYGAPHVQHAAPLRGGSGGASSHAAAAAPTALPARLHHAPTHAHAAHPLAQHAAPGVGPSHAPARSGPSLPPLQPAAPQHDAHNPHTHAHAHTRSRASDEGAAAGGLGFEDQLPGGALGAAAEPSGGPHLRSASRRDAPDHSHQPTKAEPEHPHASKAQAQAHGEGEAQAQAQQAHPRRGGSKSGEAAPHQPAVVTAAPARSSLPPLGTTASSPPDGGAAAPPVAAARAAASKRPASALPPVSAALPGAVSVGSTGGPAAAGSAAAALPPVAAAALDPDLKSLTALAAETSSGAVGGARASAAATASSSGSPSAAGLGSGARRGPSALPRLASAGKTEDGAAAEE